MLTNEWLYKSQITTGIQKTLTHNENTNPDTLLAIITGTVGNIAMKYTTKMKRDGQKQNNAI